MLFSVIQHGEAITTQPTVYFTCIEALKVNVDILIFIMNYSTK